MPLDSHQGYWDRLAGEYDGLFQDDYSAFEDGLIFEALRSLGSCDGAAVLEVGCGTGLGFSMVQKWGMADYLGVDASASMLALAKENFPEGTFKNLDVEQLHSIDRKFDYIIAINAVCSYVTDLDAMLVNISELGRTGSRVLLSFLNRWSLRRVIRLRLAETEPLQIRHGPVCENGGIQHLYSAAELTERVMAAGFTDVQVRSYGLFGGIWESRFAAKTESAVPEIGHLFGHTLIVKAEL